MRILICSNAYPPNFVGGAELIAHEQAKELSKLGCDVYIFSGEIDIKKKHFSSVKTRYDGLNVCKIYLHPKDYSPEYKNFSHNPVESLFHKILYEFNPDIVHFHNIMGLSVKLPVLSKEYGARTICTLHDFWGFCLKNTALLENNTICENTKQCEQCLEKLYGSNRKKIPLTSRNHFLNFCLLHVDAFIAPSNFIKKIYVENGFSGKKIFVINNGISQKFINNSVKKYDPLTITFVGYLGKHKAPLLALKSFHETLSYDNAILQIIGNGPEEKELMNYVKKFNLNAHVKFLGRISTNKMPEIYKKTNIFILPSIWNENQPVSITEAMASSCAVIASKIGGIPEIISNGQDGLLFQPNSLIDCKEKLMSLVTNKKLLREISFNAYKKSLNKTHEKKVKEIISLYKKTISSSHIISYHVNLIFFYSREKKNTTNNDSYRIPFTWSRKINFNYGEITISL